MGAASAVVLTARNAWAWKTIINSDGVKVSTRVEGDRQFPTFRGDGKVSASVADIVAVVQDAGRHTEWIHQCNAGEEVRKLNDRTYIIYNRTDAPWPVADRDVVLRGTMDIISETEVKIRFRAIKTKLKPVVDDVVRMPILEGHWWLRGQPDGTTMAQYQVNADPAGNLPAVLVERASRELPLFTIRNLRKQVKKTVADGTYKQLISDYMARLKAGN
jgi:hypothetical protein